MPVNLLLLYGYLPLLDRLMDLTEPPALPAPREIASHYPPMQICEDAGALHIRAVVPGLSLDNLHLTLDAGTLTLRGAPPRLPGRPIKRELPSGPFRRSIPLPFRADADAIRAVIKHGILTVTVPKASSGENGPFRSSQPEGNALNDTRNASRSLLPPMGKNTGRAPCPSPLLTVSPFIDVFETPEGFCLHCNLPGVDAKDVFLTAGNGSLHIRAKARFAPLPGKVHALEFSDTYFDGNVPLPKGDARRMEAVLANGHLRIFIPLLEAGRESTLIPVTAG